MPPRNIPFRDPAISEWPRGLGFSHHERRYRLGRSPFLSPVCWSCVLVFPIRRWGLYCPRVRLALFLGHSQSPTGRWDWSPTPRGGVSIRGISVSVPGLLALQMYGRISVPWTGSYCPRAMLSLFSRPSQSAIVRWGWPFHIMRSGIDTRYSCFRPRDVLCAEVWRDL